MFRTFVCGLVVVGSSAVAGAGEMDREKASAAIKPTGAATVSTTSTEMDRETPEPAHRYRGGWGGYGWGGYRYGGYGWGGYRSFSVGFGFSSYGWGGHGYSYPRYGWGGFYPGYTRSYYTVGYSYPIVTYSTPAYGWCW